MKQLIVVILFIVGAGIFAILALFGFKPAIIGLNLLVIIAILMWQSASYCVLS